MKVFLPINGTLMLASFLLSLQASRGIAEEVGWAQVFSPNRIAELLIQYGIQSARGFADITYTDLTVDLLRSNTSVRQVKIWPMPDWDGGEDCVISVEHIGLSGNVLSAVEDTIGELVVRGLSAPLVCLPADLRIPVVAAGQDSIRIERARATFDYEIPDSSLKAQISARVPGFATIDVDVDLNYISYWIRDEPEGYPVVYLNSGQVWVENLGGWEALRPVLPPSLVDPENGGNAFGEMLVSFLEKEFGIARPLTVAQDTFISDAKTAWSDFLTNPSRLTLSLLGDVEQARFLDFEAFDRSEVDIFAELEPKLSSGWGSATALVTNDLIASARTGTLDNEDRFKVALALMDGTGVPRNTSVATEILTELASVGDANSQAVLAEFLSASDAEAAYALALEAGRGGNFTAIHILDRLERTMTFRQVTRLQPAVSSDGLVPIRSEEDISSIRAYASSALQGLGVPRSYAQAMYWALLGKALGDQESAWIVNEVERHVEALEGSDLQRFLAPIEDAALGFWLLGESPLQERGEQ